MNHKQYQNRRVNADRYNTCMIQINDSHKYDMYNTNELYGEIQHL